MTDYLALFRSRNAGKNAPAESAVRADRGGQGANCAIRTNCPGISSGILSDGNRAAASMIRAQAGAAAYRGWLEAGGDGDDPEGCAAALAAEVSR